MEVFKFGNKKIGFYENGVFRKNVDSSKHFMRKIHSYGIDLDAFTKIPQDAKIELYEVNSGETYHSDWQTFSENGTVEDFGHGRQIFLKRDLFS